MLPNTELAKNISDFMGRFRLTQSSLADDIGLSQKQVGNIANGVNDTATAVIRAICNKYSVSADELILSEDERRSITRAEAPQAAPQCDQRGSAYTVPLDTLARILRDRLREEADELTAADRADIQETLARSMRHVDGAEGKIRAS